MKHYHVKMYHTNSVNRKPAIIERFNRTMKKIIWKKFTENYSWKWINFLSNILTFYNNRYHKL